MDYLLGKIIFFWTSSSYYYRFIIIFYIFSGQWFTTHQNWFEGVAHRVPSTNNALESFNLVVKKESTFRERLPLARFLTVCGMAVEKWSNEYRNKDRVFEERTTIDLPLWTGAYQWAKSGKEVSEIQGEESFQQWVFAAGKEKVATEEAIKNVVHQRWNTIDQFTRRAFSV